MLHHNTQDRIRTPYASVFRNWPAISRSTVHALPPPPARTKRKVRQLGEDQGSPGRSDPVSAGASHGKAGIRTSIRHDLPPYFVQGPTTQSWPPPEPSSCPEASGKTLHPDRTRLSRPQPRLRTRSSGGCVVKPGDGRQTAQPPRKGGFPLYAAEASQQRPARISALFGAKDPPSIVGRGLPKRPPGAAHDNPSQSTSGDRWVATQYGAWAYRAVSTTAAGLMRFWKHCIKRGALGGADRDLVFRRASMGLFIVSR